MTVRPLGSVNCVYGSSIFCGVCANADGATASAAAASKVAIFMTTILLRLPDATVRPAGGPSHHFQGLFLGAVGVFRWRDARVARPAALGEWLRVLPGDEYIGDRPRELADFESTQFVRVEIQPLEEPRWRNLDDAHEHVSDG